MNVHIQRSERGHMITTDTILDRMEAGLITLESTASQEQMLIAGGLKEYVRELRKRREKDGTISGVGQ